MTNVVPEVRVAPAETNIDSPKAVLINGIWSGMILPCLLLFVVTVLVYSPAGGHGFLEWDDQDYVYRQFHIFEGIRWSGLIWSLSNVAANWHPLTIISLQLDAQVYGTNPHGYHWTSILLHALNASLAFLAIRSLTGSFWRSLIVAALFALHPMRVESVAWISERKDVLSGLFFWLTLLMYVRYTRTKSIPYYFATACLFGLGLASKPMLVTTPCVLLLLDYWPLSRIQFPTSHFKTLWTTRRAPDFAEIPDRQSGFERRSTGQGLKTALYLVLEKLPLLILSFADSLATMSIQLEDRPGLFDRTCIDNCVISLLSYCAQTIVPARLSPFYALHSISSWTFFAGALVVILLTLFTIYESKSKPYLLVGWFWFVGMLVPVIGIIQVGHQARADRYTYLPQVGLFLAAVWGIADLISGSKFAKNVAIAGILGFLLTCSILTRQQISVWENTERFWREAYRLDPNDYKTIQTNLIRQLYWYGKEPEAIRLLNDWTTKADVTNFKQMMAYFLLYAEMRQYQDCIAVMDEMLKNNPSMVELIAIRGLAKGSAGDWPGAADDFRAAMNHLPQIAEYQFQLAAALRKMDRLDESHQNYATAITRDPQLPQVIVVQAWDSATNPDPLKRGKLTQAHLLELFVEEARHPTPLNLLDALAATYAHEGRFDEAIATATKAIEIAQSTGDGQSFVTFQRRLDVYSQRKPYRKGEWFTPENISDRHFPHRENRARRNAD